MTWLSGAVLWFCIGVGAALWAEGLPSVHVGIPLGPKIDFAGGMRTQRDKAVVLAAKAGVYKASLTKANANLWRESGNVTALRTGQDLQNARITAFGQQTAALLAEARQSNLRAKLAAAQAEDANAFIRAHPPVGADACTRIINADDTFLETLQ